MTTRTPWRRRSIVVGTLAAVLAAACSDELNTSAETTMPTIPPTATDVRTIDIGDTTLAVEVRGVGSPLLLIHGGVEDAAMLAGQAESLAAAAWTGTPLVRLDGDHDVYLSDPTVLTDLVTTLTP